MKYFQFAQFCLRHHTPHKSLGTPVCRGVSMVWSVALRLHQHSTNTPPRHPLSLLVDEPVKQCKFRLGVCVECWGSVGGVFGQHSTHRKPFIHRHFRRLGGGSGEVFGDFRLFCVNPLEKYSYQPIPQLAQPVPHLYQLYKKRAEPHYEAPPSLYMNVCY